VTDRREDSKADLPILGFPSREGWAAWLAANHETAAGLWLKIAKKSSGAPTVSYADAVEVALCYGWIDGQKRPLDEGHWLQRFTPRRPKSRWSKINRDTATALLARGELAPAGLRQVELAKADGRWDAAYDGQRTAEVPADLAEALAANEAAAEFFATLSSANRYAILYRVHDAKRPATRARRIEHFVAMLAAGQTLHP
jgi:uncharacterized protein YdeI (YjbR/CyaY-like superfamily)